MAVSAVDVAALAALRPGLPVSRLAAAMGSSWAAPPPYKGGQVDLLENSHGFVARIDANGLIGSLDFDHRFRHRVGNLANGMTLPQVKEAMPDLEIGGDVPMMAGVRFGLKRFPDGYTLHVRITSATVTDIAYFNPTADYVEPTAPPYPAAAGAPGVPFNDPNLKLVVLSALLDAKIVDLGTPQQLATHVLGRPVDLEEEGYDLIPEALDYLTRYPIAEELLAAVEEIELDGGDTVYPFAWYFWGGEEAVFDVTNLSGLDRCVNLKSFFASSMIGSVDMRDLVALKKLESIHVSVEIENIEALLDMSSLKYVRVVSDLLFRDVTTLGTPARRVFDTLKARGVRVLVRWATTSNPSLPAFE